ncbi:glycosyltransferase [Alteromonas ponticola]|uniref:Glycosyltransferase family 4 protein n=1 Tax=Alteromonas ponticola TaxID=2720613 RepID=A0ABX1QXT8_9ALTE|nr:glycosyltransferase family 4 protein [Alteromonas ponticola]
MRNILCLSNYRSDVGYAWWLMELFWVQIGDFASQKDAQGFVLYPEIAEIPDSIKRSKLEVEQGKLFEPGLGGALRAIKLIRKLQIGTLYLTDRPYATFRYLLFRLAGVKKIIVHDHTPGDRPTITGIKGKIKRIRNAIPGIAADAIFAISPLMRERAIKNSCFPDSKCLLVQNGIREVVTSQSRSKVRESLQIPADAVVIVTTGRIHEYKRQDLIIKAFSDVAKKTDAVLKLLIIGDGPQREEFETLARSCGAADHIQFLGYRNDVPDVLAASDIAIHAAKGEGFALSIVEYMSLGLPVITPDIPSVRQAVDDKINGLIFRDGEITDLVQKILLLVNDNALRENLGSSAKQKSSHYTVDKMLKEFEKQWNLVCK